MYQLFSKPNLYFARCGRLDAARVTYVISPAPGFLRGLRALFLSDTHLLPGTTRADIDALIAKLAAADPDLLLLGGDYCDSAEYTPALFEALGALKPRLGGFGVIGNNDTEAWGGQFDRLRVLMDRAGYRLLINESARVSFGGGTVWIAGVDEHLHGRPDARGLFPDAPQPNAYRILLSHYPVMPASSPDLMLSGHTHGGQFNLLGISPFTVGFERFHPPRLNQMAICGLHDVNGFKVLVSKGIGASRLQLRIGVRPEFNLLVFD